MIVATSAGKVRGFERDGTTRFRGIPYAAPTSGANRFRPPVPPDPWSDILDATSFAPMAPQVPGPLESMLGAGLLPQSEDCLSLNVVTPACDDRSRPVMVWIHGGGFETGASSIPWYSGTQLAAKDDVVVVSVNYRLGLLGWTALAGLGADYAGSANLGLLDQIAALHWVRENISAFGGDPHNVTIFGESAGGMSVATLLGTPAARGLFNKAIAQSGALQAVASADHAAATTSRILEALGVASEEALLSAPVEQLLEAQRAVAARTLGAGGRLLPFSPVFDGSVLPEHPLTAIEGGSARDVPLLTGTTAHEYALFETMLDPATLDRHSVVTRLERFGVDEPARIADAYAAACDGDWADAWIALATDWVFALPAQRLLAAQSRHAEVYGYLFAYESTAFGGRLRSCHALDIPFVFDVVDRGGSELFLGHLDDRTRDLAAGMRSAWAAFARTGRPNPSLLPGWPAWTPAEEATMELGPEPHVRTGALRTTAWG